MKSIFSVLFFLFVVNLYSQENGVAVALQKGHSRYFTCYDFSSDGKLLVTGSYDNSIILWDFKTGKQIRSISRHSNALRTVEFSKDNSQILTSSADGKSKLFSVNDGKLLQEYELKKNDLFEAYFSPLNTYVYLIDNRDGVEVFDRLSGKHIRRVEKSYSAFHQDRIISVNDEWILSSADYQKAVVLNISSGDTVLKIPFDKANGMSFSPDGKHIIISSAKLFTTVFDANTGKKKMDLIADPEKNCDGCNDRHAISPKGNFIVTKSSRTPAVLWTINGKKVHTFCPREDSPEFICFNDNEDLILIAFDDEVECYSLKSGKLVAAVKNPHAGAIEFQFLPSSNQFLLPGDMNEIRVMDATNGKVIRKLEGYLNKPKDDGLRFDYSYWRDKAILKFISMKRSFSLSPDGGKLLLGNVDSSALVIDLHSGRVMHRLRGHSGVVYAFDWSSDGKMIATAGADRNISLWNAADGKLVKKLTGHRELIFDVKFSADGSHLISGSWDGTLRNWDLKEDEFRVIDLGDVSPYAISYSPNEIYLVTADLGKGLHFWEPDAGQIFRTLIGHTDLVSSFDFSPDGTKMASASWDGKVKIWDVLSAMQIQRYSDHHAPVYSLRWSHQSDVIASGGGDNRIVLYSTSKKNVLRILEGHQAAVTCLRFSEDDRWLYSLSDDGVFKIWDLKSGKELYSRMQISFEEWLAISPTGFFDGSPKALKMVNYVDGVTVVPVGSLFDKYYTPSLIEKINNGELKSSTGSLKKDMTGSAYVEFVFDEKQRSLSDSGDVVFKTSTAKFPVKVKVSSNGNAAERIRIYNNGKLLIDDVLKDNTVFRGGEQNVRDFDVPLFSGTNEISCVVINENKTESSPALMQVQYDAEGGKTDLFLFCIGINEYKNPQYHLKFAVNDARSFSAAVQHGASGLFNSVNEVWLSDKDATRENILKKFEELKTKIGPEDVFVFYYAGHGVMSVESDPSKSDFFLVTTDITNFYADPSTLRSKAFSATELMAYSVAIPAQKQLFILDACHSGGALNAMASRGDGREKAIAQLARSTGTFFLTASQDAQFANESGNLKHGLFTYALLEMLEGKISDNDKKITVNEMKTYVEERVPELSMEFRGSAQYPVSYSFGQDFPVIILR